MTVGILLLATAVVAAAPGAENPIYDQVTRVGVAVGGKAPVRLPAPSMADGLDTKAQETVLAEIAGGASSLPRFLRNSAVAPHVVKLRGISGDEGSGRAVDAWFVAYGELDQFFDKQFRDRLLSAGDDPEVAGEGDALDSEKLKARGIDWKGGDDAVESYSHGSLSLLNKVKISGTVRSYSSRTKDSVIFAAMVDPRFTDDKEFPNEWAPIIRIAGGGKRVGSSQPYGGMGAYMKATRLEKPAGAILVECHLVFSEPREWFDGKNLLGAKIPAIVQSRARSMRQDLTVNAKSKGAK